MLSALKRHPDSRGGRDLRIETEVACPGPGLVSLRFLVTGDVSELRLPAVVRAERTDELWRHTCFEAFLPAAAGAYYELNFSPSTQWAAYRFQDYRSGMAVAEAIRPPRIEGRLSPGRYDLKVEVELDRLPDLPRYPAQRLHQSAVIESIGGEISYWATQHAPGKPDFHAFALPTDPA